MLIEEKTIGERELQLLLESFNKGYSFQKTINHPQLCDIRRNILQVCWNQLKQNKPHESGKITISTPDVKTSSKRTLSKEMMQIFENKDTLVSSFNNLIKIQNILIREYEHDPNSPDLREKIITFNCLVAGTDRLATIAIKTARLSDIALEYCQDDVVEGKLKEDEEIDEHTEEMIELTKKILGEITIESNETKE